MSCAAVVSPAGAGVVSFDAWAREKADRVEAALTACGIARDRRPQTVAVGEWIALAEALGDLPGSAR